MKSIVKTLNISLVSSEVIFSTSSEYGTSSSSIDSNKSFNWLFSHLIRGWLAGTNISLDLHVIDKAFSL